MVQIILNLLVENTEAIVTFLVTFIIALIKRRRGINTIAKKLREKGVPDDIINVAIGKAKKLMNNKES